MNYDSAILIKHANKLMKKAEFIEAKYVITGFILALVVFYVGQKYTENLMYLYAGCALIVFYYVSTGQDKAAQFKTDAHTTLALVEIEKNTRPPIAPT